MTDRVDQTGSLDVVTPRREGDLARDLDALRRCLEADPPPPPHDVRRRIDAIADAFLDIYGREEG